MIVKTLTLAAAALVVATAAQAHSHKVKRLEIVHPWCIETNDTANPVSVFMTIKNSGRPDKLLRATTSIAGKAELRGAGDEKAISSVGQRTARPISNATVRTSSSWMSGSSSLLTTAS
jgi:copper(I)-binding protein